MSRLHIVMLRSIHGLVEGTHNSRLARTANEKMTVAWPSPDLFCVSGAHGSFLSSSFSRSGCLTGPSWPGKEVDGAGMGWR